MTALLAVTLPTVTPVTLSQATVVKVAGALQALMLVWVQTARTVKV